ncbi:hypothetical protein EP7_003355 [Isosphaeraceae bacterium EP7]
MRPLNSSTSSSDPAGSGVPTGDEAGRADGTGGGNDWRDALIVAAWFLLALAGADAAINVLFRRPTDPRAGAGNSLQAYFNYGWSIESKIRRDVRPTDEAGSPLMTAGWVEREVVRNRVEPGKGGGRPTVSFYGMSFSNDIARSFERIAPEYRVRMLAGPAAPPNHSFALFEADRDDPSEVVVLGILGSSVVGLGTNNGMTWRFEGPAPFTYPRYDVAGGAPVAEWPMVRSLDDLRSRLDDPAAWDAYLGQLSQTDEFYNAFLFRHNFSDSSALVRMIRRAVAQRWQTSRSDRIHRRDGFVDSSTALVTLRGIVAEFASEARRRGKVPAVLLIQDKGYRDHLNLSLAATLERDRIPYVSTHALSPDTDPRNFVADGHFTEEAYGKIASALLEVVRKEMAAVGKPAPVAPGAN